MNTSYRQLTRSTSNRMIAGVCAGLGEYLGIDPTIIRLLTVLAFFTGFGGIAIVYLATIVLGFFNINIPLIHESGIVGIGFSLFVIVIAAMNLVLDFDFIEKGVERGAPKHMEWYGAFGLLVTLVWLYLEILHLLAKLQSRER